MENEAVILNKFDSIERCIDRINEEGKVDEVAKLREQIENYVPYNEQEEKDKQTILKYMDTFDDVFTRDNEFGHLLLRWMRRMNLEYKRMKIAELSGLI